MDVDNSFHTYFQGLLNPIHICSLPLKLYSLAVGTLLYLSGLYAHRLLKRGGEETTEMCMVHVEGPTTVRKVTNPFTMIGVLS